MVGDSCVPGFCDVGCFFVLVAHMIVVLFPIYLLVHSFETLRDCGVGLGGCCGCVVML